jgi:Ca-activated chloride channel family protein
MLQFQHPEYLFSLAAVLPMVVLYLLVKQWKKNTTKKIGDPALVKQLIRDYSPSRFLLKFVLVVAAFAILVIALANPRIPKGVANVNRSGIDVMIALDVSKSMLAKDIKPDRISRAKQLIAKLIDKLADDRIGIVVFAGKAYLQMPLTTDHAAAKMYLSSATPDVVPTQGTVIGDALKMCYAAFNTKEKKYRSVILISDGEDHDENALKIAKAMADEGVMVNTVGVGSPEGSTIMDESTNQLKKDQQGNLIITKLNEPELKNISVTGNGLYQLLSSADEVAANLDSQLKKLGKRSITENSSMVYRYFFQWLLAIAMIILVVELFVSEKKSIVKTKGKKKSNTAIATAMLLLLFIPAVSFSQAKDKLIRKGNEAYAEKKYDVAAENYLKATSKDPANEKAFYNLGNALYKKGKPEEAAQAYDASILHSKTSSDKSAAWYNKGVVLQNDKKLAECIDAYKNALKLNPADEDARLNLQKALLKQQQEQQKEDEKKKQQQKQQQNEKKDNPKPKPSKMTKKEAEEKLKALLQHEKNLQDKLRKADAASPEKPEKDW